MIVAVSGSRRRQWLALAVTAVHAVALALALPATHAHAAFPSPAHGTRAMAASAHPAATSAALEILEAGGNAIDGAVAAAFAISVVEPFSAGIGGGGFAVVYREGKDDKPAAMSALDFRETAPRAARADMYLEKIDGVPTGKVAPGLSVDGHLSVAVPGTVAGLHALHEKEGALPWSRVVQPAIKLARDGFVIEETFVAAFRQRQELIERFAASRDAFMKKNKKGEHVPLARGDTLQQRDLARTLRDIAKDPRSFYTGRVGRAIHEEMRANQGIVTLDDLAAYRPQWRAPLCGDYRDVRLCTMPPPSSGGVHLLQILHLVEDMPSEPSTGPEGWHNVHNLHHLIEAMRIAYADRAVHLGDPAFARVPTAELTSKEYAAIRAREILPDRARRSADVKAASPAVLAQVAARMRKESQDTSHLTVVDADRNAVSMTFTVNYGFGSGVVVPGTGVLLNDEMDDFAAAPGVPNAYGLVGGEANSVQPGKIPLSSMTPVIATRGGRFFMTAGAPGGSTIITTVLQTILHVVDFGMDAQAAVSAPRIHHQWLPDVVRVENFGMDEGTMKLLTARGHTLQLTARGWGNAMCIVARPDGSLEGGADPRGGGAARGL